MGSITKYKDKYRAYVRVNNKRKSKVFPRKADARHWIDQQEQAMEADTGHSLHDAFTRYELTKSKEKKGHDWESARFAKFKEYFKDKPISEVTKSDIAAWRDWRAKQVAGSTVSREMTLLSALFSVALHEWEWITKHPMVGVKRPKQPKHRDRVYTEKEVELICLALRSGEKQNSIRLAFLFALETAMRSGEILKIKKDHLQDNVLFVPDSKNGESRYVPLSKKALEILEEAEFCFDVSDETRDTLFRKARKKAGVADATFHDSRHTAITRLAKILSPFELARMVGHKNLNQLMTYYNESPSNIANRLG